MKFYTSDLHLDHTNILQYEDRPWDTVEKMNIGLTDRINQKVQPDDELYILGDFTLRSGSARLKELRRMIDCKHIHLITGNHDYFAKKAWASELFETIAPYKEIYDGEQKLVLCHYPIMYWHGMDDDTVHLYGHVHSREDMQHPHPEAFNVGVDVNNWYPLSLNGILYKIKERKEALCL